MSLHQPIYCYMCDTLSLTDHNICSILVSCDRIRSEILNDEAMAEDLFLYQIGIVLFFFYQIGININI